MKEFDECLRSEWAKQRMREEAYEAQARERKRRRRLHRILLCILLAETVAVAITLAAKALEPEREEPAEPETIVAVEIVVEAEPAEEPEAVAPEEAEPEVYYAVPMERELQDKLRIACEQTGVTMELALAVIEQETDFRNVMGDGGDSTGYMQVQKKWHESRMERLGVTDLRDPAGNFLVGCDYLAELLAVYPKEEALTAYNRGTPGRSAYAKSVLAYEEANYERTC